MASTFHAAIAAGVGLVYWTCLGLLIARRLDPRLAFGAAPAIGWAIHNAVALPVFLVLDFSPATVVMLAGAVLIAAIAASWRSTAGLEAAPPADVPPWFYVPGLLLAVPPAAAILPKCAGDAVLLADPIFDHAKVAIVDDIVRFGVPAGNPFFADPGAPWLVYYYLWHFAAAQLAAVTGFNGWEADAGLTWFAVAAALGLMTGLAGRFGGRGAALMVTVLSATGSVRALLWWLFGEDNVDAVIGRAAGFGGLLFQSAWVPQHLMSATCVIAIVVLMDRIARQADAFAVTVLALLAAAAFGSSTWIGGIVLAAVAPVVALILVAGIPRAKRARFLAALAIAGLIAAAFAAPFWRNQLAFAGMRGGGAPITLQFYPVLGAWFADRWRAVLDPPAFWFILLTIEFPAVYILGVIALVRLPALRQPGPEADQQRALTALAALAVTSLVVSWLFASTLAENNDLGWRAILPGAMALTVFAAIGMSRWAAARSTTDRVIALGGVAIVIFGLPGGFDLVRSDVVGRPVSASREFAQIPDLWEAVRRHAVGGERVANNPLGLAEMTPWPVNISWALLARRRSCYAGRELVLVYATLSPQRRRDIDAIFVRVFAGDGSPEDVRALAERFACRVVVVSPGDGAWTKDPFAASAFYRLAEENPGHWRIYRAATD